MKRKKSVAVSKKLHAWLKNVNEETANKKIERQDSLEPSTTCRLAAEEEAAASTSLHPRDVELEVEVALTTEVGAVALVTEEAEAAIPEVDAMKDAIVEKAAEVLLVTTIAGDAKKTVSPSARYLYYVVLKLKLITQYLKSWWIATSS